MISIKDGSLTPLDMLVTSLRACEKVPDGTARPAAILWTDPKKEWLLLRDELLVRLPELIILGGYAPEERTGPAIWVRCIVERTLESPEIPLERTPIIYLPGVAKQDLRAGEDCLPALMPLVELMFRGTMWLQHNGKDWTATAFLTTTKEKIALDIAADHSTLEALSRALREVFTTPLVRLTGKRLESEDFDKMLSDDPVRELLRWLSEPDKEKKHMAPGAWAAFRNQCKAQFQFDPDKDGILVAGEKLGRAEGTWAEIWLRYAEAPGAWPGIPALLRRARPMDLTLERSHWPDYNDEDEDSVRRALAALIGLTHHDACQKLMELEQRHGGRRGWLWAQLGFSPMAIVLESMAKLAEISLSAVGGGTPEEMADTYEKGPWRADAASWQAIATVPISDRMLIRNVVRTLLGEWLDLSARAFQHALESQQLPVAGQQELFAIKPGTCVIFVDGLRYDLARELAERLQERGCLVETNRRWAALPTVTASAKPAATPVAKHVTGKVLPDNFTPILATSGKPATAQVLREALVQEGWQLFGEDDAENPSNSDRFGWTETSKLDGMGHAFGEDLPAQLEQELERLTERITTLLEAGWSSVRVVTDHGWLWLPGGLPKVDLPKHLTQTRWSRCAVIEPGAQIDALKAPWHWNKAQYFATAPGITCFNTSQVYTHGGISLQECLLCDLHVEGGGVSVIKATVKTVSWRSFRCDVEALSNGGGTVYAELRLGASGGKSIVTTTKPLDVDGFASLLVENDDYEGKKVVLVLLDGTGSILAQRETTVGGKVNG